MSRAASLSALALLAACASPAPPLPQWTVIVATDAQVPQFGDRLQIDVLDDAGALACPGCQRQLDASGPWPISFGIIADPRRLHVRARLFRAALIGPDGAPVPPALLDRMVTLPPTTTDLRVAITLPMRCFGVPADRSGHRSCDPATGAIGPEGAAEPAGPSSLPVVSSWPPGIAVPCAGDTPPDMACIPGGAFLLGDPAAVTVGGAEVDKTPEHLVVLAPFRLDREEFTVKAYLDLKAINPALAEPVPQGGPIPGSERCTYGGGDPLMPLNCVSRPLAEALCAALGKRLPGEAEWEYAAGNTGRETPFPWGGDDLHVCEHAVVARADFDGGPTLCRFEVDGGGLPAGPVAGGGAGDVTTLGVRNLAGNVSEWVADDFGAYVDPCWSTGARPLVDPICSVPSSMLGSVRGGSWHDAPLSANVTTRSNQPPGSASPWIGLRCARD